MLARCSISRSVATISFADPARRNALGVPMFTALRVCLDTVRARVAEPRVGTDSDVHGRVDAVVLRGEGAAFCAGFDLAACATQPAQLERLVHELSESVQALRQLPVPVVAQVHGAAMAGGCALLAGCDFVIVAPSAQLGYPVHRIGVSPAVSLPAVMANAGPGRAREIALGGAIYEGAEAVRVGLATRCAASDGALEEEVRALVESLRAKGPMALRATKRWLNELDGTDDPSRFLHTALASAAAAHGDEFATMLRAAWGARRG